MRGLKRGREWLIVEIFFIEFFDLYDKNVESISGKIKKKRMYVIGFI